MRTSDFKFNLPEELIAQHPIKTRTASRLLSMDRTSGHLEEGHFYDLVNYLREGDVLVLNETKVLPARIYGTKTTGARVEFLLLEDMGNKEWKALAKPGRRARPGDSFSFSNRLSLEVIDILEDGVRLVRLDYEGILEEILDEIGAMPLPPYIVEELKEKDRYQTVYAKVAGSAAAPTAGLHFTEDLLDKIRDKGVKIARLTLDVGLGTFRPVKVDDLENHIMHSESYQLDEENARIIREAKRVVAVGTTSVRTLESIYRDQGEIVASSGKTDIFIYPGYEFKVVDLLITNFHLSESTLVMLVSAFSSRKNILRAYSYAVDQRFRFFSFGDAMIIGDFDV